MYESLFWDEDWAHVRYLGWREVFRSNALLVLRKTHGFVYRYLILSKSALGNFDSLTIELGKIPAWRSEIVIHDFAASGAFDGVIAGCRFKTASTSERLLNIATFAMDLSKTEDDLFAALSSDCRRKVRKAQAAGAQIGVEVNPDADTITRFHEGATTLAKERGFELPDKNTLLRMAQGGNLIYFRATISEESVSELLVYRTKSLNGIFLHGAARGLQNNGVGQYLQWQVTRSLKTLGLRWYDMGGVLPDDTENGIFRFKKGFGGAYVALGIEYIFRPILWLALRRIQNLLRKIRERSSLGGSSTSHVKL